MSAASIFTAAEIGRCLACTPQNARKALNGIRADGKKIVSGVETAAWRFDSLPSSVIVRLARAAKKHGFATPLQLLQNAPRSERSGPSAVHLADNEIDRAQKLRAALRPCLAAPDRPIAELARQAMDHYRREFRHPVSDRWLREQIARVIDLDRGHLKFDRIELYFPKNPAKRTVQPSRLLHFPELDQVLATLVDRTNPTIAEILSCWRAVIRCWDERATRGANEKKLKRQLRDYLLKAAPFMGESDEALKRNFNRKIREAIAGEGADSLKDGRFNPQRRQRCLKAEDFPRDLDLLDQYNADFCYGRYSQAYRELHTGTTASGQQFSAEFRERFSFDPRRSKSRMPNEVRYAIAARGKRRIAQIRGSRAVEKIRPTAQLDWSDVASGDWYSADDVTGNHYVYEFRDGGEYECQQGRFDVGRPQFLLTIDERSTLPLGVSARLAKRYERMMIIAGASRIYLNEAIGLPHQGWVLESGPWAAKDVTQSLIGWAESDEAFRRQGISLRIVRARTSRGKARIENTIGRIQSFFDFGPGFCGRDEKSVKYQHATAFVNSLREFNKPNKEPIHPGIKLMSLAEYRDALNRSVDRYSDEPQNGEWLRDESLCGLSPREAWTHFASGRPHRVLSASLAFLMAPGQSRQKVDHNGVTLKIGGWKHVFRASADLAPLLDRPVQVRFYPESPNYVFVAPLGDAAGKSAFAVPLLARIPSRSATSDDFAQQRDDDRLFTNVGETFHTEFAPPTNRTIRDTQLGSPELRATGDAFNRVREQTIELDQQREDARGEFEELSARHGIAIDPAKVARPTEMLKRLRRRDELEKKILAEEAAAAAAVEKEGAQQ